MNSKKHLYRQLRCSDKKRSKGKWTPLRSLNRTNKCQDKSDKIHKETPNQQAKRDKQQETMHRVWRRRSRHGNRYEGDIDNKHQNGHGKRSESHTNKRTVPTSISRRIEQWQAGYPEQTPPFPPPPPTARCRRLAVSPAGSRRARGRPPQRGGRRSRGAGLGTLWRLWECLPFFLGGDE